MSRVIFIIIISFLACIELRAQEVLYDYSGRKLTLKDFWILAVKKEQEGDLKESTRYLNAAASYYWEIKNYDSAIWYYNKSISFNEKIGNETGITGICNNLGMIYADMRQYEKSLAYFEKVLKDRKKINEPVSVIAGLINASVVLNNLKRYQKSAEYLEEALARAREMNDAEQMRSCYGMLAETYEKAGDVEKTIHYFNLYRSFHELVQREKIRMVRDTLDAVSLQLKIVELEKRNKELALQNATLKLEEKEKELLKFDSIQDALLLQASRKELLVKLLEQRLQNKELEFEKKEAIQKASLEKATLTRNIVIVSIIVVLIGFVILFQRYKEKQYFNHQLSERNAEIMAQGEKISEQNKILEQQKAQLEQALREKEEAVVAKSRFLSTMSHEIRTPMNAVIGFTNILLMENPLPYQMEYLNSLKFSATHLLSLLNDILDFSKIEEGKITFEKTKINLSLTLEEIRKMFLPKAEEKKISLQLAQPTEELHHELLGDIVRFNQVMTNLVSNAVKFTEKGRVVIAYKILEENDASVTLQFSVSDTGIGIPAEKLETIFESFTQATPDTTRKFGGTGLGLAISKKLIELQGGKIWVESQLGVGTTFYFTLSFEKGAPLAHPNETPSLPASNTEENSLQGMKVLLVEDNKMNVMVAKKLLERWQLEISYASDGEEAVEKVKQSPTFDVILMDLHMPNMDGVEATRQIRLMQGDYFQHVPIIALTASASVDTREKVLRAGMNACVVKPFNPSNLFETLRKYYKSESLT